MGAGNDTHGLPAVWAPVYRGCHCQHPPVPSDAQAGWHLEQSANPVREVGASTVVLSALANVFVKLSSVMVFRIVKL